MLLLPCMVFLLSLTIFPTVYSLALSFCNWDVSAPSLQWTPAGLANYEAILSDSLFLSSLLTTGVYLFSGLGLQVIIGLGLALFLMKKVKGVSVFRALLCIPIMIPPIAVAYIWRLMFYVNGPVNQVLGIFGAEPLEWIANRSTALLSIILADTWQWTPFVTLVLFAGLISIPGEELEAASLDGASRLETLRYIILPHLRLTAMIVVVIRGLDIFKEIDKIYLLTYGGPGTVTETLSFYAYIVGFRNLTLSYGAAVSWIIIIIVMLFTLPLLILIPREWG